MTYAPLGPTHQATDDFALMRAIPGMQVYAPGDPREMRDCLRALAADSKPAYVRVARGGEPDFTTDLSPFTLPSARVLREGHGLVLISTGSVSYECMVASDMLSDRGLGIGVVHFPRIEPLDEETLTSLCREYDTLLIVEEHISTGGLFTAVVEANARRGDVPRVLQISLPRGFAQNYGSQRDHWHRHGLTADGIASHIQNLMGKDA